MAKEEINYRALHEELETIVARLDDSDVDIDDAIKQYGRGMEIVDQLEKYLKTAENKVKKIKAQWDTPVSP